MVSVSTGGARIDDVNSNYMESRRRVISALTQRGISNPNPFRDLWEWHGRWKSGQYPTWASRRTYLSELFGPLIDELNAPGTRNDRRLFDEPTGWSRVDRGTASIRSRLHQATVEEDFQGVGHLCREVLISVAQAVYDPDLHSPDDDVIPSETDAKRKLDSYFAVELAGGSEEGARRHAKAVLTFANDLQHHRTATYRQAALCAEATISVVNIVAIISGRRDDLTG